MQSVELSTEFMEVLQSIPVCKIGQGDWKCTTCGPVPGYMHVCGRCAKPCTSWLIYVFTNTKDL